jgi:hypothetical protein
VVDLVGHQNHLEDILGGILTPKRVLTVAESGPWDLEKSRLQFFS